MLDVDKTGELPVVRLDLGPFSVTEPMLDAISIELSDVIRSIDPPLLVIDLGPTHHLGSRAVSVLVLAWRQLKSRKGRMAVCQLNPYSREVLRTMQLDRHWEIYATREEAMYALRPIAAKKPQVTTNGAA
jgi:anti-anti-sigma factor